MNIRIQLIRIILGYNCQHLLFSKKVSSSKSHKKTSSLWELKKSLPNTFIYESILMNIYVNANIMNTQIFHFIKSMTSTVIEGHKMSLLCLF